MSESKIRFQISWLLLFMSFKNYFHKLDQVTHCSVIMWLKYTSCSKFSEKIEKDACRGGQETSYLFSVQEIHTFLQKSQKTHQTSAKYFYTPNLFFSYKVVEIKT